MRLTVIGSAASYAAAGQACSGYLVQEGGAKVLFDCGNGVVASLCEVMDPATLDAVFISHAHPDHFVDLYALQAVLRYAPSGPIARLPLWMPHGLFDRLKVLLSGRGAVELDEAFDVREIREGEVVKVGNLKITPVRVHHTEPTFAFRMRTNGRVIAYSADTSAGDWLMAALHGADLAFVEATLPEAYSGAAPHLTAAQAGEAARQAGVKQLVLTHVWPTNDRDAAIAEASAAFGKSVTIAGKLDTYDVS